uniref:Solute carrier family 43 member 3a n=1 Tax=Oryzias latipes TaxID=8090 RepID=A0A3P9JCI7_ORYLA
MQGCVVGSKLRFWLTLVSGMLECLCFAGVVFGFASLVFVLKEDGFFSELCISNLEINRSLPLTDCTSQDEQFSLVFTIASFLNNFLSLVNGFLFDRFGTFMTRLLAIFVYTTGTLLVAFSSPAEFSLMLFPALSCIGVGGMLLLITNMQVGNLFPAHRSTIITIYNGAFDSSSAVFLLIKVLHEQGVSLRSSFLFLSICSIIHLMRTVLLMPKTHIPHPLPDSYTYGVSLEGSETDTFVSICSVRSFQSCVLSWFFLWHLAWLSIMQLRLYLFIGTLNPTLERLANNDPGLVSRYTNAFAMTQLCGVLCAPWNGFLLDRHKGKPRAAGETEQEADLRSSCLSLFLTSLQSLVFSMCVSIPVLPLQYLTFILQVLNRSFLYGGNAAFISIAFPACHFGKLYGLMMSLSAVFSLLQYPCFSLVKGPLGGDPFYVDVSLTLLTLLAFIHPAYIFVHSRNRARKRKKNFQPTGQKEA